MLNLGNDIDYKYYWRMFMKRKSLVFIFCLLLTGCSFSQTRPASMVTALDIGGSISDNESDIDLSGYSGSWFYWNNPKQESEGGISLIVNISGAHINADVSAWSRNYNHLADASLSGAIQGNEVAMRLDDDGRGHAGIIYLRLESDTIEVEFVIDEASVNGDFTFPVEKTILNRTTEKDNQMLERNVIDSDNTFPLITSSGDSKDALNISFDDSYDSIKKWMEEFDSKGEGVIWEEYTEYTALNVKDKWSLIQDSDDYMKYASIMYTMIEPNQRYMLSFISEADSKPLCSAFTSNPDIVSEKGVGCGESVDTMESIYGKDYLYFTTRNNLICEYETSNGYLRFLLNPENHTIAEWGIDKYSFQDRIDTPHE